jgi:hypothetical protein
MKIGKILQHKNQQMKVIGFLSEENELKKEYKSKFRIVLVDQDNVKWVAKNG